VVLEKERERKSGILGSFRTGRENDAEKIWPSGIETNGWHKQGGKGKDTKLD